MIKRLCFILIILSSTCSFAQSLSKDSKTSKIIRNDCNGVFTRVEQLPSLKISKEAFQDTLTSYLKAKNAFYLNNKFRFMFLVTKRSQILDLEKLPGNTVNARVLKEALLNYSHFWLPARNNDQLVCAYVKCELEFKDDKLSVQILQ